MGYNQMGTRSGLSLYLKALLGKGLLPPQPPFGGWQCHFIAALVLRTLVSCCVLAEDHSQLLEATCSVGFPNMNTFFTSRKSYHSACVNKTES